MNLTCTELIEQSRNLERTDFARVWRFIFEKAEPLPEEHVPPSLAVAMWLYDLLTEREVVNYLDVYFVIACLRRDMEAVGSVLERALADPSLLRGCVIQLHVARYVTSLLGEHETFDLKTCQPVYLPEDNTHWYVVDLGALALTRLKELRPQP